MKIISHASLLTVFIATILNFNFAGAASLKQTFSDEETFEKRPLIATSAFLPDDKTEIPLLRVSHGLRKKAVFGLVAVNVYTLQLMAAKPTKLIKTEDGVLASLKEAGPVQLNLTFLRNIPGDRISDSFKDGLDANKIDVKKLSPELAQVLKEIAAISEFKNNGTFSLTFDWSADKSSVYLADGTSPVKVIAGSKEFADQLLSIWFGKPADSKLADLKKTLIK